MSFGEAIKSVFSKYATFSGRARRSEYWYFVFFNLTITCVLYFVDKAISSETDFLDYSFKTHIFQNIYSLAVFLPGLAVVVRRLHDIGKSGWIIIRLIIPLFIIPIIAILGVALKWGGLMFSIFVYLELIALLIVEIIFIVWMCRNSEPGVNKWGPNPKGQNEIPSAAQDAVSKKDVLDMPNENMIVIDGVEYELENSVTFSTNNGTCHMDGTEPVVDGAEPSYSFHADIEKSSFNTTIVFPDGEWIFCHFHFQSNDLEFGPGNFASGYITIGNGDAGFSFMGEGELDSGQTVSFYFNIPNKSFLNS